MTSPTLGDQLRAAKYQFQKAIRDSVEAQCRLFTEETGLKIEELHAELIEILSPSTGEPVGGRKYLKVSLRVG